MQRSILRYVIGVLLAAGVLLLGGYFVYNKYMLTPEEKILASIERVRQAGVEKSARHIMAEVAADYRDEIIPNRDDLTQKVQYWCVHALKDDVQVTITGAMVQVQPDGKSAQVRLKIGGNAPVVEVLKVLNPSGAVDLDYVLQGGNWMIRSTRAVR